MGAPAEAVVTALSVADMPAMVALEHICYPAPWSETLLSAELARPDGVALGVREEGELQGMLLAGRIADAWHVLNVAVAPHARQRGLGGLLVRAALERIAEDPGAGTTLEVRVGNEAALALYERHGFAGVGVRPRYYEDGEDAVIMWRPPA